MTEATSVKINVSHLYRGRLLWVIVSRFVVAVLVFFAIFLRVEAYQEDARSPWDSYWPLVIFLGVAILNVVYLLLLTSGLIDRALLRFGMVQVVGDVVVAGVVVYLTGGIHSWFTPLLFLPILTSGILATGGFAVLCASLASIALAASAILYQIYLQDFNAESAGWAVRLPFFSSGRWPDDQSREGCALDLQSLWTREFGEDIEPFTFARRRTPPTPDAPGPVKVEIDRILLASGWTTGDPDLDDRSLSQAVPVMDVELRKHNPPLVDLVPWLMERADELPEVPIGVANNVITQVIAFYIVAFLVYVGTLRRREELLAGALDRIHDGVLVLDRSNRVHFCNAAARGMLGFHPGAVLAGIRVDRLRARPDHLALLDEIRAALMSRQSAVFLWPADSSQRGPGHPVLEVHIVRVESRQRLEANVIWFNDVTERMRAVSAERVADRMRATGTMAAGLAHEVRNPLAAIRAATQELLTSSRSGDPAMDADVKRRMMALLISECDRLDAIVGDFLRFARHSKPALGRVRLRALLEETLGLLPPRESRQDLRILVNVPNDLDVLGDPSQLKQVFLNLGRNAIEAMPGQEGMLVFEARQSDVDRRRVDVRVSDTGRGMSLETQRQIGTPFYTTKPSGTGLGLVIAMRIVEEHGSKVDVQSEEGKGTTVSFGLQMISDSGAAAGATEQRNDWS